MVYKIKHIVVMTEYDKGLDGAQTLCLALSKFNFNPAYMVRVFPQSIIHPNSSYAFVLHSPYWNFLLLPQY